MSKPKDLPDPPLWVFTLLRTYCPPQLLEEIQGDLMQKFAKDCSSYGADKAKRRMVWNAVSFFRPGILLRNKLKFTSMMPVSILGSYYKVAIRQMVKNRAFTTINVVGLAIAFCSSLLIFQYVSYELSFDKHLGNSSRIFRVQEDRFKNGVVENQWAPAVGLIGPTLKEDFQEVEEYVQVFSYQLAAPTPVVSYEDRLFKEEKTYLATEKFFSVSGRLLQGDSPTS